MPLTDKRLHMNSGYWLIWPRERTLQFDDESSLLRYGKVAARFESLGGHSLEADIEKVLTITGLPANRLDQPFATLSVAERTRVLVASLFLRRDGFPLIDEPTNHLDISGRKQLADFLATEPGGFIVVSPDRYFIEAIATDVMTLRVPSKQPGGVGSRKTRSPMMGECVERFSVWPYASSISNP